MEKIISDWIKSYCDNNNIKALVVGISGGIDSALVSTLCCFTGIRTIIVSLPIHQNISQLERAHLHVEWLKNKFDNVEFIEIDLTLLFNTFKDLFPNSDNLSLANSRSRLRMTALYQISALNGGIVVGTGNKIEDFGIGFFTKYGDGGVDISPIADLTKSEVRSMSKNIGIIEEILTAPPTDGLWDDDRTDEQQIGCSYQDLEWAMECNQDPKDLDEHKKKILNIYNSFHNRNKHKMLPVPVFIRKK